MFKVGSVKMWFLIGGLIIFATVAFVVAFTTCYVSSDYWSKYGPNSSQFNCDCWRHALGERGPFLPCYQSCYRLNEAAHRCNTHTLYCCIVDHRLKFVEVSYSGAEWPNWDNVLKSPKHTNCCFLKCVILLQICQHSNPRDELLFCPRQILTPISLPSLGLWRSLWVWGYRWIHAPNAAFSVLTFAATVSRSPK